jgi:signal transduction histidine kinase
MHRRLSRGELNEENATASLAAIEASIAKVARRISELSDITRLRLNGEIELKLARIDLRDVVQNVVQASAQRDRLVIRTSGSALVGHWDAERLERVLDNLISNALKYSNAETSVIVELADEQASDGLVAVLKVIDVGIGIPEVDLPSIFDRFQRGSNVVGQYLGAGIGLAGARQIVELHGGTIGIASKAGSGTTVTVRLPLEQSRPSAAVDDR